MGAILGLLFMAGFLWLLWKVAIVWPVEQENRRAEFEQLKENSRYWLHSAEATCGTCGRVCSEHATDCALMANVRRYGY